MLYEVSKPITLVHVFRLAEGINAQVILVKRGITTEDEAVLNEYFPRWRYVRWQTCPTVSGLFRLIGKRHWRPLAIEVSTKAVPYHRFYLVSGETPAFVIGSEDKGISDQLLAEIPDHLYIPMAGKATSYSAGMALAIVASHFAYVAKRKKH